MDHSLFRAVVPYVVGLVLAAVLYVYAGQIEYTPRPGQLGPAVWPQMAIGLMAAACLFEIVRKLAGGRAETRGIAEILSREGEAEDEPRFPLLLVGGIVLVTVYAILLLVLGFIVTTFVFLASFMYLGRYRNHGVIWATSAIVTILCGIVFLRVAYVSLPRGTTPFDRVTDAFLMLPGL